MMIKNKGKDNAGKKNRILVNFNIKTNPSERAPALEALSKHPLAYIPKWQNQYAYMRDLNESQFVASPPGNGVDCHRTWEALYLGTIPIVKTSVCMEFFKSLGLPIIDVISYDNIDKVLQEPTKNDASETRAVYLQYWMEKINNGS